MHDKKIGFEVKSVISYNVTSLKIDGNAGQW